MCRANLSTGPELRGLICLYKCGIVAWMSANTKSLLREAEISAERSTAYVRCAIGASISVFFFVLVAPTLNPDNPALDLIPYFIAVSIGYFVIGVFTLIFARPGRFRGWMTWLFTTLDLCFWWALLVATVFIIELPANHIIALPPALIVFVILTLVALRNNPWLQAYALVFVVVAFVVLFFLAPDPISEPIENVGVQIGFFELPLNIVRLSMVVLTGLILVYLAIRTRRLLSRAINETVRRTNLSRYLPPQLAARLAQIDQDMLLAGTSQEAAVLFVDMRGFTALAEGMEPESLGRFLTRYRRIVSAQVHAQNGIVDKFVGDSVMAVFGAPDTTGNDAANALECATGILHSIEQWNIERRNANYSDVVVGVGVHWGEVFCGAIGDAARLEFTVLGDTVNVAARLEQLTKEVGHPIIASQAILAEAGIQSMSDSGWISVGDSRIRGRKGHLPIFARP
jgi:adenylate cyclase